MPSFLNIYIKEYKNKEDIITGLKNIGCDILEVNSEEDIEEAIKKPPVNPCVFLVQTRNELINTKITNSIHQDHRIFFMKIDFPDKGGYLLDFRLDRYSIDKIASEDYFSHDIDLYEEELIDIINNREIFKLFKYNIKYLNDLTIKSKTADRNKKSFLLLENILRAYALKLNKKSFKANYMNLRYCLIDAGNKKRKQYREILKNTVFSYYIDPNITQDIYIKSLEDFKNEILSPTSNKEQSNMNEIISFAKSENANQLRNWVQKILVDYKAKKRDKVCTFEEIRELENSSLIFFDINYILTLVK